MAGIKTYRLPEFSDSTTRTIYFFGILLITLVFYSNQLLTTSNHYPQGLLLWGALGLVLLYQVFFNNRYLWLALLAFSLLAAIYSASLFFTGIFQGMFHGNRLTAALLFLFGAYFLLALKPGPEIYTEE